jgi:hypothetical protein
MLGDAGLIPAEKLKALIKEAGELVAIITVSAKSARANLNQRALAK